LVRGTSIFLRIPESLALLYPAAATCPQVAQQDAKFHMDASQNTPLGLMALGGL
jgi:hypothetical protein